MLNWRVIAKRPDGSVLIKHESDAETLMDALAACGQWFDEIRGDVIIDITDLRVSSKSSLVKTPFSLGGDGFIYYNPRG